jgi:SNF2 family DNA or RNA helicase
MPEAITFFTDAMEFVSVEIERVEMLAREQEWLGQLEAGTLNLNLLTVPLYDYQTRGALFLACRGRSILGDDMGLGKTVQTLAAVELLARERGVQRALVVAPASVKYQWETEIRKFTERPVQLIEGGPDDRRDLYAEPTFYRLVNYEQVVRDREAINSWKPDVIVLDEAQRIKNWESKTSKEVKKLKSRYAIVLTGTPLENKLEELFSIVQFVDERRFGPAFQFLVEHQVLDEHGNLKGYRHLDKIREKLAPIFLRRTRAEVLTQLPARTDSTIFVELAAEQREPYENQRIALARLVQKNYLTDLDRKRILASVVNMRTICDSLFMFDHQSHISPKLDEFAELIPEMVGGSTSAEEDSDPAHKVVVFSQWETMILEAAKRLDELGVGYAVLHGGLAGKDRKEVLERFKTDPVCQVFLSTDAGGTGLNLQMADTVINLELPWNPAVLEQRIARVHRMGQNRPVRVVNLVTRGTIEEKVLRTLEAKQGLFAGVFESDADEIPFEASQKQGFLEGMRELIVDGETTSTSVTTKTTLPSFRSAESQAPATPTAPALAIWEGVAHLLAAANRALADPQLLEQLPVELRSQLRSVAREISSRLLDESQDLC